MFEGYVLSIDHVQGDPFAAPSKVSVHVPGKLAGFPAELYDLKHKRIALQDYLRRKLLEKVFTFDIITEEIRNNHHKSRKKRGKIYLSPHKCLFHSSKEQTRIHLWTPVRNEFPL